MENRFFEYLKEKVSRWPYIVQMIIMAVAAFGCYTSMYAYRKAFTAGVFEDIFLLGIDYKVWLVISQVFGYMLSKFYGIRFIAELGNTKRGNKTIALIGLAWLALLGFAMVPAPYNIIFLFLNGLPLGMIWGLVFSYLEGRRMTEFLVAIMSASLVFASGFVKTIARTLIESFHVPEHWMPFATGALFVIPLLMFAVLLELMPLPDEKDKELRTERKPMSAVERTAFLKLFLPGLILTVFTYLLFTIVRDIRDNFEVEIWADVGIIDKAIYAKTDTAIAIIVLIMMGLLILVKNNMKAFTYIHIMLLIGCVIAGGTTYLYQQGEVNNIVWMSSTGLGLFMVYIPYNAIFFERMLASFKQVGNVGFVMYMADSIGYLGSVGVLLTRELGFVHLSWGSFFQQAVMLSSILGAISISFSYFYFRSKSVKEQKTGVCNDLGIQALHINVKQHETIMSSQNITTECNESAL